MATRGQRAAAMLAPIKKSRLDPTVIYVRHGSTAFNTGDPKTERLRGWLDLDLDKKGLAEADKVAEIIREFKLAHVYSCTLKRCRKVAQKIVKYEKPYPQLTDEDDGLKTWNVGEWAGKYVYKIIDKMLSYELAFPERVPPGGESYQDFKDRVIYFALKCLQDAQKNPQAGAIVCVSHTAVLRVVDGWVKTGIDNPDVDPKVLKAENHLDPGEAMLIQLKGGEWKLSTLVASKGKAGFGS